MGTKHILFAFFTVFLLAGTTPATTIQVCDDFEIFHDYWAGTEGTIWDGIIGGQDYMILMTSNGVTYPGQLEIQSANACWMENNKGVMLYKEIIGDWDSKVEITDAPGLYDDPVFSFCGLIARVSNIDAAGPGEDWVAIIYNSFTGYLEAISSENGQPPLTISQLIWPPEEGVPFQTHIQIMHQGSLFYYFYSVDGITWNPFPQTPISRTDMADLPLQIGLIHFTCSATPRYAAFDNFCLGRNPIAKAYSPQPTDGGELDLMEPVLSWAPGDFVADVNGHHVYFSADFNDVNDRKPAADKGTDVDGPDGSGRFSYDISGEMLAIGQTYYWSIDEINDPCIWPGDVWEFVVQAYTNIDTFETYTGTGKAKPIPADTLWCVWVDGLSAFKMFVSPGTSGSHVQLNTDTYDGKKTYPHYVPDDEDIALTGNKSMKFYYDNDGLVNYDTPLYGRTPELDYTYAPNPLKYFSEAYAAVDTAAAPAIGAGSCSLNMKRDWSGYTLLRIPFYGDPNNSINNAAMYAGLEDGDGTLVTLSHADATRLQQPWWQNWCIPLNDFAAKDAALDLTNIARIYIGFGDRDNPTLNPGGSGVVFFDNIQLYRTSCEPEADLNGDCKIDYKDLKIMAEEWLTTGIKADIIDNDNVDFDDFRVLANNWLACMILAGN